MDVKLGDEISPRHGDPEGHMHERKFTVVGILEASGTPNDRAVFVNMEGFYLMEDHAKPLEEAEPARKPTKPPPQTEEEYRSRAAKRQARSKQTGAAASRRSRAAAGRAARGDGDPAQARRR